MVITMGVATAIIGPTIAAMDTIARTTEAIIDRIMVAMGVRPFTLTYHQFRSPSAVAAIGNPTVKWGMTRLHIKTKVE